MSDDRAVAAQALVTLRRRVDTHFEAAVEASPAEFSCRAGCADCCRAGLSVFAIEASPIATALAGLPEPVRTQVRRQAADPTPTRCPLLVDARCSIYAERPILCRSHGLAVHVPKSQRDGATRSELHHCPLNYTGAPPPVASVLNLDAVNQPLAVMAQMWGGERIALAELAASRP